MGVFCFCLKLYISPDGHCFAGLLVGWFWAGRWWLGCLSNDLKFVVQTGFVVILLFGYNLFVFFSLWI